MKLVRELKFEFIARILGKAFKGLSFVKESEYSIWKKEGVLTCEIDKDCSELSENMICINNKCIKEEIDPCEGISCSNHGTCAVSNGNPLCACAQGYHPDGLNCIEDGSNNPCIKIMIKDNGKGFDLNNTNKKFSLGLITMRERIENINGKINIISELNKGTQIELILKNKGSYENNK